MKSLSGIGLGISLVFGCLFLALVLEIYYMLFWKKRFNVFHSHQEEEEEEETADADEEDKLSSGSSSAMEFLNMFCFKKVSFLSSCGALTPHQICASVRTQHQQQLRSSGTGSKDNVEVKSDDEVLFQTGFSRYLFTIMEETMEDLESDDDGNENGSKKKLVKRRQGSTSLNELLLLNVDEISTTTTPYMTPISSTSQSPNHVFNPFLESSCDAEISKIKASPPPKFRFLQAAEEKFHRMKMMEEDEQQHSNKAHAFTHDSFITIVIGDHTTDKAQ